MNRDIHSRSIIAVRLLSVAVIGCTSLQGCQAAEKDGIPLLTYIITIPKGLDSEGLLISDFNESGTIVGEAAPRDPGSFGSRAIVWHRGKAIDLGPFGNYRYISARAVNNKQWVVGTAFGSDDDVNNPEESNPAGRAFLWRKGKLTELKTLGGKSSSASDINEKGQIVGNADTKNGNFHACLWQDDKLVDLGTLGGRESTALGINEIGEIVGFSDTKSGATHAFLWKQNKMQDLGTLGGKDSTASGINDKGQIVGDAEVRSGHHHAFLWEAGKMHDLGTLDGSESAATAINNQGQIVGTAGTLSPGFGGLGYATHPFIYENGKMYDLNTLLPKSSSWSFEGHMGPQINNKGQIAGVGRHKGEELGFILAPQSQM